MTGNTGIDAVLMTADRLVRDASLLAELDRRYQHLEPKKSLVLVTGHRRESFGAGFEQICEALKRIVERGDAEIVYPVHLNPSVRYVVHARLEGLDAIHLIEPVDYLDMVYLMRRARILLTDSGGLQEEGPALGKPVLVMRDVTERPEALASGAVKLVGTGPSTIRREVDLLLDNPSEYQRRARPAFPYGDGTAARQIADAIEKWSSKL